LLCSASFCKQTLCLASDGPVQLILPRTISVEQVLHVVCVGQPVALDAVQPLHGTALLMTLTNDVLGRSSAASLRYSFIFEQMYYIFT
jgi:hypothetical protein